MARVITIWAPKGGVGKTTLSYEVAYLLDGVLIDLDWDGGNATTMWGHDPESLARSPLLNGFETGRLPNIRRQDKRPKLVASHPDLALLNREPKEIAEQIVTWAGEWDTDWVVIDTHPGSHPLAYGALGAADVVLMPAKLGMRETDALQRALREFADYPLLVVPSQIPTQPAKALIDRFDETVQAADVLITPPVFAHSWIARRQFRSAITSSLPDPPASQAAAAGEYEAIVDAIKEYFDGQQS